MSSSVKVEEALLDIASHLGATVDLEKLLDAVLERFTTLMDAERAAFVVYSGAGSPHAMVTHQMDWDGDLDRLPISLGLLEEVRRTSDVVIIPDTQQDGQFGERESVRALSIRMLTGVPVLNGGKITGVLYADSGGQAALDWPSMLPVLRALSRLVASALENARLFAALEFRNQILAELVHELRGPLATTLLNTSALLSKTDDDDTIEILEDIFKSASAQAVTVDNALTLARANLRSGIIESLVLAPLLQKHVRRYRILLDRRKQSIVVRGDAGLSVATFRDRLLVIFDNLIVNALKYSDESSEIVVALEPRADRGPVLAAGQGNPLPFFRNVEPLLAVEEDGFICAQVKNRGESIPKDLLARLFEPFSKGPGQDRELGSTGLGLSIAAQCVGQLGGRIWAESAQGQTTMSFTVPIKCLTPVPPVHD